MHGPHGYHYPTLTLTLTPTLTQVEWPLTEVLHARAMATYSAVWRVLLRVRRAGVTASAAWLRLASLSRALQVEQRTNPFRPTNIIF